MNYVVLLKRLLLLVWAIWLSVVVLTNLADAGKSLGLGRIVGFRIRQLETDSRNNGTVRNTCRRERDFLRRRHPVGSGRGTAVLAGRVELSRPKFGTQGGVWSLYDLAAFVACLP